MTIREEFNNRIIEIDSFYEILTIIESESPRIIAYNLELSQDEQLQITTTKIDTLRSTAYLLLYNLIESTVYNSIISIFDEISDNQLKYFEIVEEVQRYWINNLYKHDDKRKKETIIETISSLVVQIINETITLTSSKINYGGSLDAKKIFETAKSMKISIENVRQIYDKNTHGQTLIEIKQKRNWLAHGEKSFIEVGSTSSYNQLFTAKQNVIDFLNEFITSVELYLRNQEYKIPVMIQ